jgi:uncharacterized protein involved in outer membrane biogenesis
VTRPRKVLLLTAAALAALVLVAAVAAPLLVDADRFRPEIEAKLQAALRRQVKIGALKLSLWSGLALTTTSVRIGEPIGGAAAQAIIVETGPASVHVAWLPLLSRRVECRSIDVERVSVTQDGKPLAAGVSVSSRVAIAADGAVDAAGSVAGTLPALTAAPPVEATFAARFAKGTLDVRSLDATVGPVRVRATGRLADLSSTAPRLALDGEARLARSAVKGKLEVIASAAPQATFDVAAPLIDVDEILAAVPKLAGSPSAGRASASLIPEAHASETAPQAAGPSFARRVEATGTVRAERCTAHGLTLSDLTMQASLAKGVADFRDVRFSAYGGKAQGSLSVRPFEARMPFSVEQSASGIAIGPLIAALAPAEKGTVDGKASLTVRLTGEAGAAALLPTTSGAGQVAIVQGKIASFGVIKQVMKALEIAGASGIAKDETPFDHLSAHFDVAGGTASTKDLEFRSADLDGDGAGTVGSGGTLALDVLASFSKTVSDQLVAKTHALSIRQGSDGRLSVPLQIRGSVQQPQVQLDVNRVLNEGVMKELKKEGTKSLLKRLLGH